MREINFCHSGFLIFELAFAKNRCFFDFVEFPLKYGYDTIQVSMYIIVPVKVVYVLIQNMPYMTYNT